MNKLLCQSQVLVLSLLFFTVNAQTLTVEKIPTPGFSGVKKLNNEQGFYFSYQGEKGATKGMFQIITEIYSNNLEKKNKIVVETTRGAEVISLVYDGSTYFMFLKNEFKRNYNFITIDSEGKIIARRDAEKVNDAVGNPRILSLPNGEFLIIENKSLLEKNTRYVTYQIEKVNKNLESLAKIESPKDTKKDYRILDAIVNQSNLYLLTQDQIGSDMQKHLIVGYDLIKNAETFQYKLYQDQFGGFPTFLKTNNTGDIVTGGLYFKGGWVDEWNSDGMFAAIIGKDGKQKSMFQASWKQIKDQIKSNSPWNYFSTGSMVFVEDLIVNSDNSFFLIAENFKVNSNGFTAKKLGRVAMGLADASNNNPVLTVEDILLFKFDNQGKFIAIDRVQKEPKEMQIEKSGAATYGYLELATKIAREDLFPYKGTVNFKNASYLVFVNPDGTQEKAFFAPVPNKADGKISSIELKYSDINSKGLSALQKASGNQQTIFVYENGTVSGGNGRYKGIILASNSGKILVHHYQTIIKNTPLKLWLETIPE